MSSRFFTRMTLLSETITQSASGFPTSVDSDGTVFGAAMRTVRSLPTEANNGELEVDGTQVIATVRRSTATNALREGNHVRIDGDKYRITGISKRAFERKELELYLKRVTD